MNWTQLLAKFFEAKSTNVDIFQKNSYSLTLIVVVLSKVFNCHSIIPLVKLKWNNFASRLSLSSFCTLLPNGAASPVIALQPAQVTKPVIPLSGNTDQRKHLTTEEQAVICGIFLSPFFTIFFYHWGTLKNWELVHPEKPYHFNTGSQETS